MSARVIYTAMNMDLRLGHEGLLRVLNRHDFFRVRKQKVEELPVGSLVYCVNTAQTKLKALGGKGMVVGYLRTPNNRKLYREALQYLHETFGASGFDYDAATKKALARRGLT